MDPLALCQLLLAQHGRLPSLSEIMAALGGGPGWGAGAEAGAEDERLTALLRERDAWDQASVRQAFMGMGEGAQGPERGGLLGHPGAGQGEHGAVGRHGIGRVGMAGHGMFLPTP